MQPDTSASGETLQCTLSFLQARGEHLLRTAPALRLAPASNFN